MRVSVQEVLHQTYPHFRIPPYPKPHSTRFLVTTGIFGSFYHIEQYLRSGRGCCSGQEPVRLGKSVKKYLLVPRNVFIGVSGTRNPDKKLVFI